MRTFMRLLALVVFTFNCWFAWEMLALMVKFKNAGRVLPFFTSLCISLRPLLAVLPIVALAYCLWLWVQKEETASRWRVIIAATMTVLILFAFPAMLTSFLLPIEPVKTAVAAR